ncbi:MAG: formylglycine-generating enzyme family protein [Chitinophagales bacterium]
MNRTRALLPVFSLALSVTTLIVCLIGITACQETTTEQKGSRKREHFIQFILLNYSAPHLDKEAAWWQENDTLLSSYSILSANLATQQTHPQQIAVFGGFVNLQQARGFMQSPQWLKHIGKGPQPEVKWLYALDGVYDTIGFSRFMVVTQTIQDYDHWRKCFFKDNALWLKSGLKYRLLFHTIGNSNEITLMLAYSNKQAAADFARSESFMRWLKTAGVISPPQISYMDFIESNHSMNVDIPEQKDKTVDSLETLSLTTNSDCDVFINHKYSRRIITGHIQTVQLPPGSYSLLFLSVANAADSVLLKHTVIYPARCAQSIHVDLQKIVHQRVLLEQSPIFDTTSNWSNLFDMVFIEGGSFQMGSESGYESEGPVHTKSLRSYYLGRYEVTQNQWYKVTGQRPSHFTDCDNCPVENISYYDALKFIAKINSLTGKQYRLPTETEWEYAARGGRESRNYCYSGSNQLNEAGWCLYNSCSETHPVGQKKPNEIGLFDMTGNVFEWCSDWFSYSAYGTNNYFMPNMQWKVIRGSSWSSDTDECRITYRNMDEPDNRGRRTGLRLAHNE